MATNERSLRLDTTYRNRSFGVGVDRTGAFLMDLDKALVAAYDSSSGSGWRREGAGDGLSALTTTLDANLWTGNSGKGYYDGGSTTWTSLQGVANSCSNALAWARYSEWHNGVRTGRQFQWQRSSSTAAGSERSLNVAFGFAAFTGTPSATSPYTTSTNAVFWFGSTAWNSAGSNWWTSTASGPLTNDTATCGWNIWIYARGYGNVYQFGFEAHGNSTSDRGFVGGYFACYDAAPADSHPFICGAGTWINWAGGDASYTGTWDPGSGTSTRMHGVGASSTWYSVGLLRYSTTSGGVYPPGNATSVCQPDLSSKHRLMPAIAELDNANGTNLSVPKGTLVDMLTVFPASDSFIFPCVITDSDANVWLSLGCIALPWPSGVSLTNWGGGTLTSSAFRRHLQPALGDTTPPTVSAVSPGAGAVPYNQAFSLTVSDSESGVASITASLLFADGGEDLVVTGEAADPYVSASYNGGSDVTGVPASYTVTVAHDTGLRGDFTLRVVAVDFAGNVATSETAYTISGANPAADDVSPPTLTLISPADLTDLSRDTPIVLEADDDRGIEMFVVLAVYPTIPMVEGVYDGDDPDLPTAYTVTPSVVGGKQRYSILRTGGWPAPGFLRVKAIDGRGNKAA